MIIITILLVLIAALAAIGWVLSSRVLIPQPYGLMPEFEVVEVTPLAAPSGEPSPPGLAEPLARVSVQGRAALLELPVPDSAAQHANTRASGVYALAWLGGHGLLGPVIEDDGVTLKREVRLIDGELPSAGTPARLENFVYRRDPGADLGLPFEELSLDGEVGKLRAWFVPAPQRTAVLLLHGRRRGELAETLRPLSAFNQLGFPTLALAYRNHDLSDPSPDGLFHYGASEWRDALTGARELRSRGYERVILYGMSMGGAVTLEALKRWPTDAPEVVGIVLDSPLIDPYAVIELGAEKAGIPLAGAATSVALMMARLRTGADFAQLRQARTSRTLSAPLLLIAGENDSTVPIAAIDDFAANLLSPFEYHRLAGVEHVEAWNQGPLRYQQWLAEFTSSLEVRAEAR